MVVHQFFYGMQSGIYHKRSLTQAVPGLAQAFFFPYVRGGKYMMHHGCGSGFRRSHGLFKIELNLLGAFLFYLRYSRFGITVLQQHLS
jgi:hypothetical protein